MQHAKWYFVASSDKISQEEKYDFGACTWNYILRELRKIAKFRKALS